MNEISAENREKLKHIELLLLDVDGVLTNGQIVYGDSGMETKAFNVRDGQGIRLLANAGIKVGIVTGRSSEALDRRCRELGIEPVCDGVRDKAAVLEDIVGKTKTAVKKIAFVGDDLPDLKLMAKVGLSIAVADAHDELLKSADIVTRKKGGCGAVREVCEMILKACGLWDDVLERYR